MSGTGRRQPRCRLARASVRANRTDAGHPGDRLRKHADVDRHRVRDEPVERGIPGRTRFLSGHRRVRWSAGRRCASRVRTGRPLRRWPRRSAPKATRPPRRGRPGGSRATRLTRAWSSAVRRTAWSALALVDGSWFAPPIDRALYVQLPTGGARLAPRLGPVARPPAVRGQGWRTGIRCARSTRGPQSSGRGRAAGAGPGHGPRPRAGERVPTRDGRLSNMRTLIRRERDLLCAASPVSSIRPLAVPLTADAATTRVAQMCDVIRHRGPDDEGCSSRTRRGARACGASASSIWPAAISRFTTKTARSGSSSTARSTTSASCARELEAAGHRVLHVHATPKRSSTPTSSGAPTRFARLRGMFGLAHLGSAHAHAAARARPHRHQAAALRRRAADACTSDRRLKSLLCGAGPAARARPRRARSLPLVPLHAARRVDLPATCSKLPPGHLLTWQDGRIDVAASTGSCRRDETVHAASKQDAVGAAARRAGRRGPLAPDQRRAARRVSLRRRRLEPSSSA